MKGFVVLIAKTYSYLTSDNDKSIKPKGTRNASEKENLNLKITKLFWKYLSWKIKETIQMKITLTQIILQTLQRFHNRQQINSKIATNTQE